MCSNSFAEIEIANVMTPVQPLPYSKREQRGWYMYDLANSTFQSTVLTLFLGPYLTVLAKAAAGADGRVHPLGIPVDPRSWWGYLISISVITQIFVLPIAGTIADFSPNKKGLMALFAYTGALATAAMFFLQGNRYLARWSAVPRREPGLRRVGGGLQLVSARTSRLRNSATRCRPPAGASDIWAADCSWL